MFATISRFSNPVKGEQKEVFSVRSWDEIAEILSRYADKTDRSSLFLGFFSEAYQGISGKNPVLVGGGAVEVYTHGGYVTGDLDLICDAAIARKILTGWGFSSAGFSRTFYRPEMDLYVELLGAQDVNGDPEATSRVEAMLVGGTMLFCIISLEDLIIDRLLAFVHWGHRESALWAQAMMKGALVLEEQLDTGYVRRKLSEQEDAEKLSAAFESLLKEVLSIPEKEREGEE